MNTYEFNMIKNDIINQIVQNEIYFNEYKFRVRNYYPEQLIIWLTKKKKLFKVTGLSKYIKGNDRIYEISYKDVNIENDLTSFLYNKLKYELIDKPIRKGYMNFESFVDNHGEIHIALFENNESVVNKFNHLADKYRPELECNNWSNEQDETNYAPCPYNTKEYLHLSKEDSQSFEHFCQWLGFDNYQDFTTWNDHYRAYSEDEINTMYQQFLNDYEVPDWSYKDENEELYLMDIYEQFTLKDKDYSYID